jgi:hypothetical protein
MSPYRGANSCSTTQEIRSILGNPKVYYHGCVAPPFLTSTLGRGEWPASRPVTLPPGKEPPVPICRRLGGSQTSSGRHGVEKSLASAENRLQANL